MPFPAYRYAIVTASECALWFCVQTFNTSVQFGVLTESKFKSWSYLADNGTAFSHFEQSSWRTVTNIPPKFNTAFSSNYSIQNSGKVKLRDYVANTIRNAADMTMIPGQKNDAASAFTQAIYYRSFAGDLDEWISRIAQTMTNAIRVSFPAPVNNRYTGTMSQMEPFIHVRWAWLTFPILMVLSSLVFLVASIVQTRRLRVRA